MKQTLLNIKRTTSITTREIADTTGLTISETFIVEAGGYSTQEKVEKVLRAFNRLSGMQVRLSDITYQLSAYR